MTAAARRVLCTSLALACAPLMDGRAGLPGHWSAETGALPNGCNAQVNDSRTLADGRIALVGIFSACGTATATSVAIYDPGSDTFTRLGDGVGEADSYVHSVVELDGQLVVAGRFETASGTPTRHVARWNGSAWEPLGSGLIKAPNDIAVHGGHLYAAGSDLDGPTGPNVLLKRWDGSSWSTVASVVESSSDHVMALATFDNALFVTGSFSQFAGVTATGIAQLRDGRWSAVSDGAATGLQGVGYSLQAGADRLCVVGDFDSAGTQAAINLACWNGQVWSAVGGGLTVFEPMPMLIDGPRLLIGGAVIPLGQNIGVSRIAMWDGQQWSNLLPGPGAFPTTLAQQSGDLYVGGGFIQLPDGPINNFTRRGPTGAWQALGGSQGQGIFGINDAVMFRGELHVTGSFRMAGSTPANNLARWDGQAWHPVGAPGATGLEGTGYALHVVDDVLYVGGDIESVGGMAVRDLARWDGMAWSALGNGPDSTLVSTITDFQGQLYAGIKSVGTSFSVTGVQRWNGTDWTWVGSAFQLTGFAPGTVTSIDALAVHEGALYAGGRFNNVGVSQLRLHQNLARFDGVAWQHLGAANGVDKRVRALASAPDGLYVGGDFDIAGSFDSQGRPLPSAISASRVTRFDGSQFHDLDGGIGGSAVRRVHGLTVHAGRVYAHGFFARAGSGSANNVAAWDGIRWQRLDAGTNGFTKTMVPLDAHSLFVAGNFGGSGELVSAGVARWTLDTDTLLADGFEAE